MSIKNYKIAVTTLILLLLCATVVYAFSANCYCSFVDGGSFINAYAVTAADCVCDDIYTSGWLYCGGVLQDVASEHNTYDTWGQANLTATNPSGTQQFRAEGYHVIILNDVAKTYNSSRDQSF